MYEGINTIAGRPAIDCEVSDGWIIKAWEWNAEGDVVDRWEAALVPWWELAGFR